MLTDMRNELIMCHIAGGETQPINCMNGTDGDTQDGCEEQAGHMGFVPLGPPWAAIMCCITRAGGETQPIA